MPNKRTMIIKTCGSEKITSYDMYELFQKSCSRTSSLQKLIFVRAGIWPFYLNFYTDEDFKLLITYANKHRGEGGGINNEESSAVLEDENKEMSAF